MILCSLQDTILHVKVDRVIERDLACCHIMRSCKLCAQGYAMWLEVDVLWDMRKT